MTHLGTVGEWLRLSKVVAEAIQHLQADNADVRAKNRRLRTTLLECADRIEEEGLTVLLSDDAKQMIQDERCLEKFEEVGYHHSTSAL